MKAKNLLYTAALGLLITACTKPTEEDFTFVTPDVQPVITTPTPTPTQTNTPTSSTETPTQTPTPTLNFAYPHEVLSFYDDGKGSIEFIIRLLPNEQGQEPIAYYRGDAYWVLFGGTTEVPLSIDMASDARVEYEIHRETASNGAVVVFSFGDDYLYNQVIGTVEESIRLQEGKSVARKIYTVTGDGAAWGGVATTEAPEYAVANGNHNSLHTHLHEDGHLYDFAHDIQNNHDIASLSDMWYISDYGNNNGTLEWFADLYSFYHWGANTVTEALDWIESIF